MNARDPWLWTGFAFVGGAALDVALLPTLAAAAAIAVALVVAGKLRARAMIFVIAAFALAGVRAHAARSAAARAYVDATQAFPEPTRCVGRAIVTTSPVVRGDGARARFAWTSGTCGDRPLAPFSAFVSGVPDDLARGDVVELAATISPAYLFRNDGTGDGLSMIAHTGAPASGGALDARVVEPGSGLAHAIDRARAAVRKRIGATYHPGAEPLGRALVLGEADLAPEDDAAFRSSGLSHLLAVSGTHIVVAVLGLVALVRLVCVRIPALASRTHVDRWIALAAAPVAFVYSDFAGGGGSALRAAAMTAAMLVARALGKRAEPSRAFAAALVTGAALDPLALFDVSFALSVSATLGMFTLSPALDRFVGGAPGDGANATILTRARRAVGKALSSTLGPSIACAPALAGLAPSLPVSGLAANVLAAPVGEAVALPICLAHAVLGFAPVLERGAARVGSGALLTVLAIARGASATGLNAPVPPPTAWQGAAVAALAAIGWLARGRARLAVALFFSALLVALELGARAAGHPRGSLRVSALDVGQGDSILVDMPDGEAMLVDGGGLVGSPIDTGVRVVAPVLRARRRSRVDVVVLSHPHPDHFTGLVSGLDGVDVGEIWETGEAEHRGGPAPILDMLARLRARGTRVVRPGELCGHPRRFGAAIAEVLAPCPGIRDERGANDNSFVIKVTYRERSVLLTGDAEHVEESELLARDPGALRADLLKVGHHGSRTSTSPAFVDAVSPRVAMISCGVRNRFGHPHHAALEALAGRLVLRTDRGGEWRWQTDGRAMEIDSPYANDELGRIYAPELDP